MVRPSSSQDLGGRGDAQSDRRRGHMADIEVDTEALMAGGQQVLDGRKRRRLDHVDHDRRRQHRNPPGADERRGVLRADDDLGRSGDAGRNA